MHGHAVILCASAEDVDIEREYVRLLTRRRIDGLLLVPAADGHGYLEEEQTAGLPMVALDRLIEGVSTDMVLVQNRAGTRKATEHLIDHGHRRIAFVGDDEHLYTTHKRLQGYGEAMRGASLQEVCRIGANDITAAEEAMHEFLKLPSPPTAIFAGNNLECISKPCWRQAGRQQ